MDSDGDGIPDTMDLDDDNDGILDEFEACFDFGLDGSSFDNVENPTIGNNSIDKFTDLTQIAPPFSAVNSDGEVFAPNIEYPQYVETKDVDGVSVTIEHGQFLQLLQGNGNNTLSYWDEQTHTSTSPFDRVVVIENVSPNTTYEVSFAHRTGNIYFTEYQPGGQTLLQVQSMNTDYEDYQLFDPTPHPDWKKETFSFTTDSETTQMAILFSAYDPNADVSLHIDAIYFDYQGGCDFDDDVDGDGVPNHLDLDSDNDGIYDVVEAGFEALDTNLDGILDANDTAFVDTDYDEIHDSVLGVAIIDTDNDGTFDMFELNSDGDSCFDTTEVGYTDHSDPNSRDGILGEASPATVDEKGRVINVSDGYTIPIDFDNSGVLDYREQSFYGACFKPDIDVTKTISSITDSDGNPKDINSLLNVGDIINYEIQVVNNSLNPIENIIVSDTLSNQESSFELQTTFVEELNTGNHEEVITNIESKGNTSNPNNYTIVNFNEIMT